MSILAMTRGDTRTVTVTVQPNDVNGNPVLGSGGVNGWLFWMTAKHDTSDADNAAVFQKLPVAFSVATQGNTTTPAVVTVVIAPTDTASLPGYQVTLVYDIQAKDTSGNIFTIDEGTLTVTADVTVATS